MTTIFKRFKKLAFFVASLNIMFSPLAVAAQAESNNVKAMKEFLKESGLNKREITVGEYYRNISKNLSPEIISKINPYFLLYQDDKMPAVDPVTFRDKNNVEQVRLALTIGEKTYSIQTEGSGDKVKLKFNSYTFENNPWKNPESMMDGLAREIGVRADKNATSRTILDLKLAPTFTEWSQFSKEQKIEFLIMTRYLIEDIQKVLPVAVEKTSVKNESYDPIDKFAIIFELLNPEACAGKAGKNAPGGKGQVASGRCIVAGYVTEYGQNGFCGGRPDGRLDLDAQQNAVKSGLSSSCPVGKSEGPGISCNPLFYGYQDSGSPYCVSGSASHATDQCNDKSKLRRDANETEDIKRIISSFLKDKTGHGLKSAKKNAKGEIEVQTESTADYEVVRQQLDALDKTFRDALDICEAGEKNISMDSKINKPSNLMKTKEDQRSACHAIVKRYIAVQQLQLAPTNPPPKDIAKDIKERESGCPMKDGACTCTMDGAKVGGPSDVKPKCGGLEVAPAPERTIAVEEPLAKEKDGFCTTRNEDGSKRISNTCGIIGLGLIGLFGFALYKYWDKDKKVKQKHYDPAPSPVTGPTTGNPPVTPPVVENPPIAPVPIAETPTNSSSSPTPTDSGTVRKATPGAR